MCVLGGFVGLGAYLSALWRPYEFIIIIGTAVGAMLISAPFSCLRKLPRDLASLWRGPKYNTQSFEVLLAVLYTVFRMTRRKGILALEDHIEYPSESPFFQSFPAFLRDNEGNHFLCDYLRMLTMGVDDPFELETLMDQEIIVRKDDVMRMPTLLLQNTNALTAIGIITAILRVIHTMGAISQLPAVLVGMIGTELVGTFLGVLLSYGFGTYRPWSAGCECRGKSIL
jgi:chemotaxis protein MotA